MRDASKTSIRSVDMPIIDKVFAMESGYVLNFTNPTFADFFREELSVDIYDSRWAVDGGSKGKRLRYYLRHVDRRTALTTLETLWEYRETSSLTQDYPELDDAVRVAFFSIIERLGGSPPPAPKSSAVSPGPRIDEAMASSLADNLLQLSAIDPQPRGYAFERFLKQLFDAYGLAGRASFSLKGEQVDGSFVLGDDIYLLEAKWTCAKVDAATLRSFNAKVEDKAKWSRGLLVSYSGFTSEGLTAFGSGKSVICMDGFDLHEILSRRLNFATVLVQKVRHAAETGKAFVSIRDLDLHAAP